MLRLLIAVVLVVAAVAADFDSQWVVFKTVYNKNYSPETEQIRKYIWMDNNKIIQQHNEKYFRGQSTFYLGENEYADMTSSEFVATMNGYKVKVPYHPETYNSFKILPASVDWRKKGYVTPVKYQANCTSCCWAFSSTGAMEGQHFNSTGKLVNLSESNLMDCIKGCSGDNMIDCAFKYVIDNKGIDTEASYPFTTQVEMCHFHRNTVGATFSSYKDIASGFENALQEATAEVGPISVYIDASHTSFQFYKGGVYNEPSCSRTILDHTVLVVGYGIDPKYSKPYWLVKNSWGTGWGMEGYIWMSRNADNQCGIATKASYPIV